MEHPPPIWITARAGLRRRGGARGFNVLSRRSGPVERMTEFAARSTGSGRGQAPPHPLAVGGADERRLRDQEARRSAGRREEATRELRSDSEPPGNHYERVENGEASQGARRPRADVDDLLDRSRSRTRGDLPSPDPAPESARCGNHRHFNCSFFRRELRAGARGASTLMGALRTETGDDRLSVSVHPTMTTGSGHEGRASLARRSDGDYRRGQLAAGCAASSKGPLGATRASSRTEKKSALQHQFRARMPIYRGAGGGVRSTPRESLRPSRREMITRVDDEGIGVAHVPVSLYALELPDHAGSTTLVGIASRRAQRRGGCGVVCKRPRGRAARTTHAPRSMVASLSGRDPR